MKKQNVIKIIPKKRKPGINNNKKKYFEKLSKNNIVPILSFFTESEKLKLFTLNNKFKAAFCDINSISQNEAKIEIKYIFILNKLKKQSKNFSPYLNVLLNMNIINLNEKFFGLNLDEGNKYNRFKIFLESNYKESNTSKISP